MPARMQERKPTGVPIPKERPGGCPLGGMVEIDTMRLSPLTGVVRYHFSAVRVPTCGWIVSRFGVVGIRGTATAGTAKAFLIEVRARFPFPSKRFSIDGGSDFMATFAAECQVQEIALWVSPPHSPKLNGHVERMNRTCSGCTEPIHAESGVRPDLPSHQGQRVREGRRPLVIPRRLPERAGMRHQVQMREQRHQRKEAEQDWRRATDRRVRPLSLCLDSEMPPRFLRRR